MQSPESCVTVSCPTTLIADEDEEVADMETSVKAVEEILNYKFIKPKLLEEALTHSSCIDSISYQRLEFVGDAALGLAITNYVYLAYPELDPGQLSLLRAANISTEKLARVAVRHGLYKYVRHNATALDEKVKEFVITVQQEEQAEFHGGAMKAPKVLADIVESVAAAVYVDCGFDLKNLWLIFRGLLEPIITLDLLEEQPQPVTMLYELCQKDGKQVDIKHWRKGEKDIASIYVDGQFIISASSENKENAKLHAAKAALQKLAYKSTGKTETEVEPNSEIDGAKQKLHELCGRKKWPIPAYRIEKQIGPAHDRRFICSVQVPIAEGLLFVKGEEKSRVKDAENSAASAMIWGLQDSNLS
ncbi:PREDICTED: ribonuclease 3-like protein 2 [Nicotiana attenuata]|uniref:Ribonuclease 3-like protein 2 n=1 Tax=Nicotiana attenuata TaxID=49451 RepID=A0A1J6KHH7_NICAT|nr:PREDICTED: ribonuclease 3-like protein 2 [Nicotiana attenuata]OIT28124.1 ribonuclease 3-like protein 2 [Nicotiana attenuata]